MKRSEVFLRKHSSTILTVVGSVGVVATSVFAVKATPKALLLIDEAKQEKGDNLTVLETIKVAWKPYIPAAIIGMSTIACIFGANYLSSRHQASLMSAYALLDSSYKQYRNKVEELYGPDANSRTVKEIAKSNFDETMEIHGDKELFFDYQSMRYFESTFEEVKEAETIFRRDLMRTGYACLNDYYDLLGIPHVKHGYDLWWTTKELYKYSEIDFEYEITEVADGLECCIITMPYQPSLFSQYAWHFEDGLRKDTRHLQAL